jgi:hypothetical protein
MTAVMIALAFASRTHSSLWITAFICDTVLLSIYMLTRS